MKKIILIFSIILASFSPLLIVGQTQVRIPENFEDAKNLGEKTIQVVENQGWGIIKNIWNNDALPIWKNMYNWTKEHVWNNFLGPKIKNIWSGAINIIKDEAKQRTPAAQEKLKEEKQQIKEEIPVVGKTLWEKIRDFIK
jgi:hypothetical protein